LFEQAEFLLYAIRQASSGLKPDSTSCVGLLYLFDSERNILIPDKKNLPSFRKAIVLALGGRT
jgi:hypothetical protein